MRASVDKNQNQPAIILLPNKQPIGLKVALDLSNFNIVNCFGEMEPLS